MNIEHGKREGDQVIMDEVRLDGMIAGNVIVENGGALHLHGMVVKNLVVRPGGKVHLYGMVSGSVRNEGGELSVLGMIGGRLERISGTTTISADARVQGGVV